MAKATNTTPKKVSSILVRMYRAGTGDFFVLKFFAGTRHTFTLMIDCGCINGGKDYFAPFLDDLAAFTQKGGASTVDLLVITHQHDDHINGFKNARDKFQDIRFKKVWFAWTEDDKDPQANNLRQTEGRMKMALAQAAGRLKTAVEDRDYKDLFQDTYNGNRMYEGQKYFADALAGLTELNSPGLAEAGEIPTMRDLLEEWNVIKEDTVVEYLNPGDLIENLEGATGLRFFIWGPPRQQEYIFMEDREGEVFEKRESPSTVDFSFLNLFMADEIEGSLGEPFDEGFCLQEENSETAKVYHQNEWQKIDHDWLFSAGGLALKLYKNINNTSLAFAIQFEDSGKVLFFPGDSEMGCWLNWHDHVKWTVEQNGQTEEIRPADLFGQTVFYKVSHHLSQNGTATRQGIDLMTSTDLTAMATLDFKKILTGWKSTMPNDYLGAVLLEKTKGKLYFVGDRADILRNIDTGRVTLRQSYLNKLETLNKKFDGELFIDCRIRG